MFKLFDVFEAFQNKAFPFSADKTVMALDLTILKSWEKDFPLHSVEQFSDLEYSTYITVQFLFLQFYKLMMEFVR